MILAGDGQIVSRLEICPKIAWTLQQYPKRGPKTCPISLCDANVVPLGIFVTRKILIRHNIIGEMLNMGQVGRPRVFLRLAARGAPDMHYRIHASAGRWTAAAGRHVRNRVQPGVYDQRQASKRFLPQRQNEVHRVPQRSKAASVVRMGRNGHITRHGSPATTAPRARHCSLPSLWPSVALCGPRSASVVKIASFKPRDNLASSIVARVLRPHN